MLYQRNRDASLSADVFRQPGSEYRGTPFWAWNCELEKEELLRQLEILKEMGFGGAHMHVRTGMSTPYLSDAHMALIRACTEKCREEGMLAWLYDEDRWPSGAAGGIVTRDKRFRARHLLFTVRPYGETRQEKLSYESRSSAERAENGTLLACYDVELDAQGRLAAFSRIGAQDSAQGVKWYVYVETPRENPWFNNQTYVNTLDKSAMRRFIEVTYERYLETVGGDFSGVVPAIFTDEPQVTCKQTLGFAHEQKDVILPWSDDIPETFCAAYGEDLLAHLPELLWELPEGRISVIRYHYHDHICERFAEAFADQCGAWCRAHGLMLTGHMMEEPTLHSQCAALGEAMRNYRGFQLPGIDMLCDRFEFTTAKQAQSAAHQYGREGVLSELYGVTGWDFDFRGHKLQGDWQAALGVTVRVPHLAWVSMKGEAKRDYPASINYQSPWWKDYRFVEDHFARVNAAMTRGSALVRVGVIHPIESYWLHWGPSEQTEGVRAQMDSRFESLTRWLISGNIDFDFISESLLPVLCPQGDAPLSVGEMAYDVIVVPGCETLRCTTLDRLEAFAAAGGRLVFLGEPPKYENAVPTQRGRTLWESCMRADFDKESVLAALEPVRMVDIRDESGGRTLNLIHQLRIDGEDRWLFIAHCERPYHKDVPVRQRVRISVRGEYGVLRYDTQTGEILPMDCWTADGFTHIRAELYDYDSLLLRCTGKGSVKKQPEENAQKQPVRHPVPALVEYALDEPNVYLMDKAEFALDNESFRPAMEILRAGAVLHDVLGWPKSLGEVAQPWTIQEPKPEHTVRLRFTVRCAVSLSDIRLALEDADAAVITVNGKRIDAKPDGCFTDRSIGTVMIGALQRGENVIETVIPYGRRTSIEWCYLLGNFGVRVCGEYRELIPAQERLGFDDVTRQGLAHYGGNITYLLPVSTNGGEITLTVPHYAGAAVRVEADGRKGYIAYPPYRMSLGRLPAGEHVIRLTLLGHRGNCFGPVHNADPALEWLGPNSWRTEEHSYTESYRLKPLGIFSAPWIEET